MTEKPTYEELEQRVRELEQDVPVRKQMEKALKESEERFKLLYERAPLGYQSLDENGHFIEVNQAWLDAFGYSRDEVIGKSFGDFLHPDWADHFKDNFPRFKAVGEVLGVEFEMVKKDGSNILVLFNGKIGKDEKGNFLQTHCILHDITAQRRTEKAIRESEDKYRRLVESTADWVWSVDIEGRHTFSNQAIRQILGYEVQEILGESAFQLIHPDDRERIKEIFKRAVERKEDWENLSTRWLHKDDSVRFIESTAQPVLDTNNNLFGFSGIGRDITDRIKAEEDLKLINFSVNHAKDAMYWMGPDAHFTNVNDAACRALGYTREELLTMSVHDIGPEFPKEVWPAHWDELRVRGSFMFETTHLRKDGSIFPVEISINYLKYGDQEYNCAFARDITERKHAENALRESEKKYRMLVETMNDGLAVYDKNNVNTYTNEKFCQMLGYSIDEIIGRPAEDFLDEDNQSILKEQIAKRKKGDQEPYELVWTRKDGQKIYTIISPEPMFDSAGQYSGSFAIITDITEIEHSKQMLQESEAFTKTVLDNLPIGIAVNSVDPAVKFEYMNDNFPKYYRTTKEALADPGAFWNAVYEEPEFREEIKKKVLDDCASGDPERMHWVDVPITRKGDETSFIIARNIPIHGKQLMISTVWDVTERKRAEEALRESEEKYRGLFDSIRDSILVTDTNRTIIACNPAFTLLA